MLSSIHSRLLLLALTAFVPLCILTVYGEWAEYNRAREHESDHALGAASNIAGHLAQHITDIEAAAATVAALIDPSPPDPGVNQELLAAAGSGPVQVGISAYSAGGGTLGSSLSRADQAWLRAGDLELAATAVAREGTVVGAALALVGGARILPVAVAVPPRAGTPPAVIVVYASLDRLMAELDPGDLGSKGTITIISHDGFIVGRLGGSEDWAGKPVPGTPELEALARSGAAERKIKGEDGITRFTGIAPVPNAPWSVAVGVSEAEALAHVRGQILQELLFTGAVLVLVLGFTRLVGGSIVARIRRLTREATAIREGEFGRRVYAGGRWEVTEVGELAQAINRLTVNLEERLVDLEHTTAAHRQSESLLTGVISSAMDAIITTDVHHRIVIFNEAAESLFGMSANEAIGMLIERFAGEGEAPAPEALLGVGAGLPVTLKRADGTLFPAEATVSRVDVNRQVFHTVILRDLSERLRLQAELLQAQKMEAIGLLAGGVAHDFNNVLTAITGYSEIAASSLNDPEKATAAMDQIRGAADRAASLTRQLVGLARRQRTAPEVLDISSVAAEMERMLARLIGEDIELTTTTAPRPAAARIDRSQLEQVILNLAINSRDAMPGGGRLAIEVAPGMFEAGCAPPPPFEKGAEYVRLTVSDTGMGIDPALHGRIFDAFFTTKAEGKGSGLGLSIVANVVRQAGGAVTVASTPGAGATFHVYLPAADAPPSAPAPPASPVAMGGNETILLVEDDDSLRTLERYILEQRGYRVIASSHGARAVALAGEEKGAIDLLVTDVVMPGMSGPEVAREVLAMAPRAQVLFISGYAPEVLDGTAGVLPGRHFLQKPFSPEDLVRRARELLDEPAPAPPV